MGSNPTGTAKCERGGIGRHTRLKILRLRSCGFESRRSYQFKEDINKDMEKEIHLGDILVMLPFAYILSQSLLMMDFVWFFGALWIFDIYAKKMKQQDV